MSIKYISSLELQKLTDNELDNYATKMMNEQIDICNIMDIWSDNYNLVSDEYERRRAKRCVIIENNSTTRH